MAKHIREQRGATEGSRTGEEDELNKKAINWSSKANLRISAWLISLANSKRKKVKRRNERKAKVRKEVGNCLATRRIQVKKSGKNHFW